jgi:hypothetical protein
MRAVLAGILYFVFIFALGFALGTARVLVVAPLLGEVEAVLLEIPIMLAASWIACGWLVRRFRISPTVGSRLSMGVLALALLMLAEFMVSVFAFERTPAEHLASYLSWSAVLGLAAQIAFAAMPLVVSRSVLPVTGSRPDEASTFRNHP